MLNNDNFFNAVNVAALAIGLQNLEENRQQTAYNDVHASNQKQAEYLLKEIDAKFEAQNKILSEILERLERLEGERK